MTFTPTDDQRQAIEAEPGPVLVLAGPGAGETHCLIGRVHHLITVRGCPPERICAVTCTNRAANEIAERLEREIGEPGRHVTRGTLRTYWDKVDELNEVTVTYPPATISGTLQSCTLYNGWCTTPAQLSLSGNEPVQGYTILALEGTRNGQIFSCPGSSCSVPLVEGNNSFTYWALSSFADTSTMGTLAAKVDSQQPIINGTLSGTRGSNGWYVSFVDFNGSASDATSGLAKLTCSLDGSTSPHVIPFR